MRRWSLLVAALALLAAACGNGDTEATTSTSPATTSATTTTMETTTTASSTVTSVTATSVTTTLPPTTTGTTTPEQPPTETLVLYYMLDIPTTELDPWMVPVFRTWEGINASEAFIGDAVAALFRGPSADELGAGMSTAVPDGTTLLGVTIEDGIASVNTTTAYESGGGTFSMTARLAQLVYTITQFEEVEAVTLELEGVPVTIFSGEGLDLSEPLTRADFADLLPPIALESPAFGAEVEPPLRLSGTVRVPGVDEVEYSVVDWDGREVAYGSVAVSDGVFEALVEPEVVDDQRPNGAVIVWSRDAAGAQTNLLEFPIVFSG